MRIAGIYSFNKGREVLEEEYAPQLAEITEAITSVNEENHKSKRSKEKTMRRKMLYSPRSLNRAFKADFGRIGGWHPIRVKAEYSVKYYHDGYKSAAMNKGAFREMDFVKNKLGVEVQFGKYAFMVYNVCAKMTIFQKLGHISAGVEIVPMKAFVEQMSTGVSYFEQFVWDLEARGVSNIDIPVLILGIAADWEKGPLQNLPDQIIKRSDKVI
jgi:hypothetical protein